MLVIKYWKSILMTLVILFLSFAKLPSMPLDYFPPVILWDKIAHFSMYFILTFLLLFDSRRTNNQAAKKSTYLFICLVFPLLLGIITEISQALFFFPRAAEWIDWISNTAGVFVGWGIFTLFKRRFKP